MIDAVISYHDNPQTCGVTKFGCALAKRLGVPHHGARLQPHTGDYTFAPKNYRCPLVSIKDGEWKEWWRFLGENLNSYQLFFHDVPSGLFGAPLTALKRAWRVYAGNETIAEGLREHRPDVAVAFCPSTIDGTAGRGMYRVLAFGMAHKLSLSHFRRLKDELELTHPDYTIELSTAVHEGNPWDAALEESVRAMRDVFGPRLRVLGFLGDDALAKELRDVDAVAAYYVPALRANNTSYWAAVEAGKKVYTNRDEFSPKEGDPPVTWDALVALLKGAA